MSGKYLLVLDAEKLFENAIISIQLGIEDFQISQLPIDEGGNPTRALSSVKNLFAGMLLLFKYKISVSVNNPEDAYCLIFNPPNILPKSDGCGSIKWSPVGKFKKTTIDVLGIQQRFESFGIDVDWEKINKLQDCRNHLEHLHPANTLGEVAGFVSDLFPVLSDFITSQLNMIPHDLLCGSWEIMLQHRDFYEKMRAECEESWGAATVPENMIGYLQNCSCDMCSSVLIRAAHESIDDGFTVANDETKFKYRCISCGYIDVIAPLLFQALHEDNPYDPRSGEESSIELCYECGYETFLIHDQHCAWCSATLEFNECSTCGNSLEQDEQDNDGLCGYHYNVATKDD